ncbi:MAG: hypothetical protein M1834_007732 [Cirrosporium novae-zelandiae]|nr:MAG: hypothetical protein M1834_007732 [Cirrosporium novae-zelandiae]
MSFFSLSSQPPDQCPFRWRPFSITRAAESHPLRQVRLGTLYSNLIAAPLLLASTAWGTSDSSFWLIETGILTLTTIFTLQDLRHFSLRSSHRSTLSTTPFLVPLLDIFFAFVCLSYYIVLILVNVTGLLQIYAQLMCLVVSVIHFWAFGTVLQAKVAARKEETVVVRRRRGWRWAGFARSEDGIVVNSECGCGGARSGSSERGGGKKAEWDCGLSVTDSDEETLTDEAGELMFGGEGKGMGV